MKHIRFRIGDAGAAAKSGFEPDVSTYGPDAYNIVVDHCSFAWGVDESMSVSGPRYDGPNGTSRKVTLSYNIISEGLMNSSHSKGAHSMGTLVHDYCTDVAVIGNFFSHQNERNPWYKGFATGVIVNNVIYNPGQWSIRLGFVASEWKGKDIIPQGPKVSIVGNYMKSGANTNLGLGLVGTNSKSGEAYMEDNIALDRFGKPVSLSFGGIVLLDTKPFWLPGLTALAANKVVDYVVQYAGARPKDRDSVDKRIIADFKAGKGQFVNSQKEVGGYPKVKAKTRKLAVPTTDIDEWLHNFSLELE
jgi:hypothetical protein